MLPPGFSISAEETQQAEIGLSGQEAQKKDTGSKQVTQSETEIESTKVTDMEEPENIGGEDQNIINEDSFTGAGEIDENSWDVVNLTDKQ